MSNCRYEKHTFIEKFFFYFVKKPFPYFANSSSSHRAKKNAKSDASLK